MIKNSQQSGNSRSIPQHNKDHIWEIYCQWTKINNFSLMIRNKTRVSAFTLLLIIVLVVLATAIRQEIKGIQIGKEEVKLSLFADDMIVYIENSIVSTKKLLDLISIFGKVAGYRVNIQKLMAFFTPKYRRPRLKLKYLLHSVKGLMAESVNWLSQYLLHLPSGEAGKQKTLIFHTSLHTGFWMLVRFYQSDAFAGVLNAHKGFTVQCGSQ